MTSHSDSHTITDIKPEIIPGGQTGNGIPHDKYNIRGIAHVCTNRKDNIFMQGRLVQSFKYILEWGQGTCTLRKHTLRWTYSALRHFSIVLLRMCRSATYLSDVLRRTCAQDCTGMARRLALLR